MAHLIFKNSEHIQKTIDTIKYQTPSYYIDKITILDDTLSKSILDNDINHIIYFDHYGKASERLIEKLIAHLDMKPTSIISPRVYDFDKELWSSLPQYNDRINFRNDMSLYNKIRYNSTDIVETSISDYRCYAINRDHLIELGGFIDELNDYKLIELSIRNWAYGYTCFIDHSISYSCDNTFTIDPKLAATVSAMWFGKYHEFGNIVRYSKSYRDNASIVDDNLFRKINPELISYNKIKNRASGRSIAVIADGPSLDYIDFKHIYDNNDIIIGVDLASDLLPCDFIVSFNHNYIISLLEKYDADKILAPHVLYNVLGKSIIETNDLHNDILQFELASNECSIMSSFPIINSGHPAHSAIHLALLMNPNNINLYGVDFKFVNGKSHTAKIPIYNNGKYYPENTATLEQFSRYENMLVYLSILANALHIPIIRHGHL